MNRIINTLALATAGLVLLCGCSADPATDEAAPGGNDGKTVPVSFAAELPATRATIEIGDDRFNGAWEVDIDKLGIHATLNGVAQINKPFVFSSEGIFKGELTPGTGAWTYLAYYPHGEQSLNGTSATIPFGNTRIQKGGTYNSLFDILIAPAQTTANSAEGVDDSGERIRFNMQRLTSILDFDLTNSTSDPIRCVLLTAESDDFLSAKSLNFDLAQGEAAAPALDTEERSKSILISCDGGSITIDNHLPVSLYPIGQTPYPRTDLILPDRKSRIQIINSPGSCLCFHRSQILFCISLYRLFFHPTPAQDLIRIHRRPDQRSIFP